MICPYSECTSFQASFSLSYPAGKYAVLLFRTALHSMIPGICNTLCMMAPKPKTSEGRMCSKPRSWSGSRCSADISRHPLPNASGITKRQLAYSSYTRVYLEGWGSNLKSSLIHFACIIVAPPRLFTQQAVCLRREQSRGRNYNAGKMDQTWSNLTSTKLTLDAKEWKTSFL
mgnify:CR=1 FL=1